MEATSQQQDVERGRFHHFRLNVTDRSDTMEFYQKIFSAVPVQYGNTTPGLLTDRSFLLFNDVDTPASSQPKSGIWHYGWGSLDVPREYEWFQQQGVKIHTPLYNVPTGPDTSIDVTYIQGSNDEVIEVNTETHRRICHVHLLAEDVVTTGAWYQKYFDLAPGLDPEMIPKIAEQRGVWVNMLAGANMNFVIYSMPNENSPWWSDDVLEELEPTDGKFINHYAFSFRNIEPVFERMQNDGVEIVDSISYRDDVGHKSFFVRGPDKVLIEIVEAKPMPEGLWDKG